MEEYIVNPRPKTDWKVGDTAYLYSNWARLILKGTVTKELACGPEVRLSPFTTKEVMANRLFETRAEAIAGYERSVELQTQEYLRQIPDVAGLIKFATLHCIAATHESTDWLARKIYLAKAKELLGVDIRDDKPESKPYE